MKKFLEVLKFIGLFLWQLPQNIVALCMMPFLGKLEVIDYRNYCYSFKTEKMMGGISLGSFVYISEFSSDCEETIAHEQDGHVKQSHMLGWLYLIVIGIPSITWAWTFRALGFKNYYWFYTEAWANKLAGLETYDKWYALRFKKEAN